MIIVILKCDKKVRYRCHKMDFKIISLGVLNYRLALEQGKRNRMGGVYINDFLYDRDV